MAKDGAAVRFKRPKGLERLTQAQDSPFPAMRDAMVFCAALGWNNDRRIEISGGGEGEPIRWEVMVNHVGTEPLMDMIALQVTDDLNVLSHERFEERVSLFEEFANGGVQILEAEMEKNPTLRLSEIARDLIQREEFHSIEDEILSVAGQELDL